MPTKDGRHAYSDEEKSEIIAHVLVNVACGRFVSRVFREDDLIANGVKLPNPETFWRWVLEDDNLLDADPNKQGLSNKLVQARERGIEALLDEVIDIADDGTNDWTTKTNHDGTEYDAVDRDHIQRSKLRIETRIKLAQMLKPKKYGPKLDVTSDGKQINDYDAVAEARKRLADYEKERRGDASEG